MSRPMRPHGLRRVSVGEVRASRAREKRQAERDRAEQLEGALAPAEQRLIERDAAEADPVRAFFDDLARWTAELTHAGRFDRLDDLVELDDPTKLGK